MRKPAVGMPTIKRSGCSSETASYVMRVESAPSNITLTTLHKPHPYTEDDAEFWIKHCQSAESSAPSGTWSAETGAEGPKLPTNYIIALDGEACGSIGLDFGTGMSSSERRILLTD